MFHIEFQSPRTAGVCDSCGGSLIQRADDNLEVIQKRMSVFHQQTQPLERFYSSKGVLKSIDAGQAPDLVYDQLVDALGLS
jgi:adenylate kinase